MQLENFLEHSAARFPDKTALVRGDRRLTYAELEADCNRLARAMIEAGVARGDRVVVHLDNSVEAITSIFAALKAGAVFMPVHPTTKADKLTFLLNNSRATTLVCPASKVPLLEDCWNETPHLSTVFLTGKQPSNDNRAKRFLSYEGALERFGDGTTPPAKRCINIDLAALIYTSGSSGQPKGVMLTHLNMTSASTSITTYLENRSDDVILSCLPLSFDYGLYQAIMAFQMGATLVLEQGFTFPHAVLTTLGREKVTGFPLVPTMAAILLQLNLKAYDLSSLRYLSSTAAALPTEHIRRLRETFAPAKLYSMYGLTECKRVSYLPPDQLDIRPNSIGRGMPNEEVYIVDDAGNRVGPGVVGELVVRGANVMKGYWENPEETDKRLKPGPVPGEMVLHTGDLFQADDEGYLYWVGRRDDIIKCRGEKVAPREVENALCQHPAVAEAAVIGVNDPILGQGIKAFVSLHPGTESTPRDLQRHCASLLEDFMVPQRIEIRETLPKTGNGKVNKRELANADASLAG